MIFPKISNLANYASELTHWAEENTWYLVLINEIDCGVSYHTEIAGRFKTMDEAVNLAEERFHETCDMYGVEELGIHDYQLACSWRVQNPVKELAAVECLVKKAIIEL